MPKALLNVCFIVILFTLGGLLYGHTLDASWHFDDYEFIVLNERIHDLSDMASVWRAGTAPTRFIAFLSFALNYHWHQLDVTGYHMVNILIHLCNALLVWQLVRLFCQTPSVQSLKALRYKEWLAVAVSLAFLTHPVQTQAVTYITQRFASLATFFYLSSLTLYVCGRLHSRRRAICFSGAFVTALLGMFTKQIVLTLPVMVLLVEVCLFQNRFDFSVWKKKWRWYYALPLIGLFLIIPTVYGWRIQYFLTVEGASRSHTGDVITFWTYFLTQFRVIPTYIRLLFFPLGQTLDYDFVVSTSLLDPKVILGAVFLGGVFYSGVKMYAKNRFIALGVFWFFLTLSVESSFIPILQVIFEHRCYLPSVGFFLVVMTLLFENVSPRKAGIIICCILISLSYLTRERNKVWQTEVSLWEDIQRKAPQKERSYTHLGVAYLMQGRYPEALTQLSGGIALNPENYMAYHNRGVVYSEMGELTSALKDFDQALRLNTENPEVYNGRGGVYEKMGDFSRAFAEYNQALKIDPKHGAALANRANIFIRAQKYPSALKDLMAANAYGYPVDTERLQQLKAVVLQGALQ